MKLYKILLIYIASTFLLTGCVSMESPEKLITQKPIYDEEKYNLNKTVENFVRKNEYLLPINADKVGIINEVDLNNDGINEIVVFRKKEYIDTKNTENNKIKVGFTILQKNIKGEYVEYLNTLVDGTVIEYADFCDLDNSGNLEIVLLTKENNKSRLKIYKFNDKEEMEEYEVKPTWINEISNFNSVKIRIDYFNNDDILDIMILNYDQNTKNTYLSIANYKNGFKLLDYEVIKGISDFENTYITIGNIEKNKKGIILDYHIIENNEYMTQIFFVEEKKVRKVFKDYDNNLTKPYYIPPQDINEDKVIEIPLIKKIDSTFSMGTSENVNWYKYNGKIDASAGLVFISQIYYNYNYNFKLFIPNSLMDKVYIEQEYNGENVMFKFYYVNNISKPKRIFTIVASSKNTTNVEEGKANSKQGTAVLGESEDYIFTLVKNDIKELNNLKMNTDVFVEYFSLIY